MNTHTCIKPGCENTYQDSDPDAYYCPSCQEQKKVLARQIDKQYGSTIGQQPSGPLQEFDAVAKVYKRPDGTTASFMKTTLNS
jgi:hypothetical protein